MSLTGGMMVVPLRIAMIMSMLLTRGDNWWVAVSRQAMAQVTWS